ncbi:MAG: bacterial extracellular solute-binding family protein [Massilia sp.]|nr:bacterial extracellular solute-binding family protein [Massilia sp.]
MPGKRLALLALAGSMAASALAADIKVLTAGAFKPVVVALAPEFERKSGHRLVIDNDTAGALARRIGGGEQFDLVVLTEGAIGQLGRDGKLAAGAAAVLGRVGIGVAVKRGAALPDIGSVAAFERALLGARAVAYIDPAAGGSSGVYLAQLFDKMGIAAQIKAKAVLVPGGLVAQRVVSGEADIAVHQISEILAVPDAVLVGPIPAEIQNYTVYAGGVSAGARDPAAAKALLAALRGEAARTAMKARGMEAAEPVAAPAVRQ